MKLVEENAKNNKQTNEKVVKQETIMDTANTKETGMSNKKVKSKKRKCSMRWTFRSEN